jgi:nucleotide-binding universal stress UspA family protein
LQPLAENRYSSAALLAFDLTHPEQVRITARGKATRGLSLWQHCRRWFAATRSNYRPSALRNAQSAHAPIVMVAVPYRDVSEATLQALRQAVKRVLDNRPGARLSCVTVVPSGGMNDGSQSEVLVHQQTLGYLREWTEKVDLGDHLASYHVLSSSDIAQTILNYAEANHVNLIIMGAATHGLQIQRFIATVPIKVAMHAPCTVMLVKG